MEKPAHTLSPELQRLVSERVTSLLEHARKVWPSNFKKIKTPHIRYNLTGRTAGQANFLEWTIRLNPVLLIENLEDMILNTVGHEFSHLVVYMLWPEESGMFFPTDYRKKPHGKRWKAVMREFGLDPRRTHDYDTSSLPKCKKQTYKYACNCRIVEFSSIRHNRIINKGIEYSCGICNAKLRLKKGQ